MRRVQRFFAAVLAGLLFYSAMHAQDLPDYQEIYVNDFAELLPDAQEEEIRAKLKQLRDDHGIEFTVVTIRWMNDYGHHGAIEPFATQLFNKWGVGDADRNDGVMLLVSRYDREMRIEVGSGYGTAKNAPMKAIIEGDILPYFRNDNYANGIEAGVDSVIIDLTGVHPEDVGANFAERALNKIGRLAERSIDAVILFVSAIGSALTFLFFKWRRLKPRICPNDGTRMMRMRENMDDALLESGQQVEERLKSRDYDVWVCSKCDHITIEAYKRWFSRMGACRSCGYKTLEAETTILESATTTSTGLKRIDNECHHCGDTYSATRVIPMKSESSSSSSSSSFGGGSSSGGGASGSW